MSIEKAILARSEAYIKGARAIEIINHEAYKGCDPRISAVPVNLEPVHHVFQYRQRRETFEENVYVPCEGKVESEPIRLSCHISPNHHLDWIRAERFLKELCKVSHRIGFEIIGNCEQVDIVFLLNKDDVLFVQHAFSGEILECQLNERSSDSLYFGNLFFYDFYYETSPYYHLQTQPTEIRLSPFEPFIRSIATLPATVKGFVQVLFEPARNDWTQNVQHLTDLEYVGKTITDPNSQYRTIQMPSGDLKNLANDAETKSHDDKPFYFAALRLGVCSYEDRLDCKPLTAFMGMILKDSKPAQYITEKKYQEKFNKAIIREMFYRGIVYRPGILVNSSELASLVHIPSIKSYLDQGIIMEKLEPLSLPKHHSHLLSGITIGRSWYQGSEVIVCLSDLIRTKSTHLIGKPGTGKTTTQEYMILQKIEQEQGCVLIDPHGDSVKRLLTLIPENRKESIIFLDLGDPDWVPLWNPLIRIAKSSIGRQAVDLVAAIKSFVQQNAWGDRLEHILRNCFNGLLHLNNATFFDLLLLLSHDKYSKSDRQKKLVKQMLDQIYDPVLRLFWERDFKSYKRDEFAPPLHKLSKLLTSDETLSMMFTQPENRFDFQEIIESDQTVLIDLSNLGPETKQILGCFFLSFFHHSALSRNKMKPEDRKPFALFCDEGHMLTTDTLEHMIAECRKFGIELTLAHQFMSQFSKRQQDALSSVGTTTIFNIDVNDANYFTKSLQKKVSTDDLITLERGEAIARIDNDIIKIKTPHPDLFPRENENIKNAIIQCSRELYCRRTEDVRRHLRERQNRSVRNNVFVDGLLENYQENHNTVSGKLYDEFE